MVDKDEQIRRLKILINKMERIDKHYDRINEWIKHASSIWDKWFRDEFKQIFYNSCYDSVEEALSDPILLKKTWERMYNPDIVTPDLSLTEFITKVEERKPP